MPSAVSDTGKRQELCFPTREKAQAKSKELRDGYREHGESATVLPPRLADDALHASKLLEPYGVTLTVLAKEYVMRMKAKEASVTLTAGCEAWLKAKGSLREKSMAGYKFTVATITKKLGGKMMTSITGKELTAVMQGGSYAYHRRNVRAMWGWCAKAPRRWCKVELFEEVDPAPKLEETEICVIPPAEVELLLRTAEEHFPETVPLYAVEFFGGDPERGAWKARSRGLFGGWD